MPTNRLHDQGGAVLRVVSFVQSGPWLRRSVRYVIPNVPVIDLAGPMAARALADHGAPDLYSMCASPMSRTDLPSHRYRVGAARLEECNAQPSDRRSPFAVFLPKAARPQAAPTLPGSIHPQNRLSASRPFRSSRLGLCFPEAAAVIVGLRSIAKQHFARLPATCSAQTRPHPSPTRARYGG
jgi:hypothetical protein